MRAILLAIFASFVFQMCCPLPLALSSSGGCDDDLCVDDDQDDEDEDAEDEKNYG